MMNINLLPWRLYERERQRRIKKIGARIVIVICILMTFFYLKFFQTPTQQSLTSKKSIKHMIKPPPISLQTVSVQQMKFVGFIEKENLLWAFIMLPNSQVELVKVHDIIGKERAVVMNITEQEVVVRALGKIFHINNSFVIARLEAFSRGDPGKNFGLPHRIKRSSQ